MRDLQFGTHLAEYTGKHTCQRTPQSSPSLLSVSAKHLLIVLGRSVQCDILRTFGLWIQRQHGFSPAVPRSRWTVSVISPMRDRSSTQWSVRVRTTMFCLHKRPVEVIVQGCITDHVRRWKRRWLCVSCQLPFNNVNTEIYNMHIVPVLFHGCDTRTLSIREAQCVNVCEFRARRRVFGPKSDEMTGDGEKLRCTLHRMLLGRWENNIKVYLR
jgi:hypothetical protein